MDRLLTKTFNTDTQIDKYTLVQLVDRQKVGVASDAAKLILGVSGDAPSDPVTKRVDVTVVGIVPVIAGGAVAIGAAVTCNASGKAIAATEGNETIGIAMQAATAAGDVIEILIK